MQIATAAFQHEALLYEGPDGFLTGIVPFIREGVRLGQPVLVVVGAEKIALLEEALGEEAEGVRFGDMEQIGRNPGRIIPVWHDFLAAAEAQGDGARGVGEPVWSGRTEPELVECQLHESLLNVAFAGAAGFHLVCPYDAGTLRPAVLHEARCSHPMVTAAGTTEVSHHYRGDDVLAPFDLPLPTPPPVAEVLGFDMDGLPEVRELVLRRSRQAGLPRDRAQDLVLATSEVAANSVHHGGGRGVLRIWQESGGVVCEVRDRGWIEDPLVGRHRPSLDQLDGRGVWIAHQICDLVQVRSTREGTSVRLFVH